MSEVTHRITPAAVAEAVQVGILDGDFAPGQRLVEADLTEQFGCSRGVVRAALVDLEHRGYVVRTANQGARVREVTMDEALANLEVRMVIEGLCAAKAAQLVSDAEVDELRGLADAMRQAAQDGDPVGLSALNTRLHDRIIEISAQPIARESLARLKAHSIRHQFRLALRPGRPSTSVPEHLAVIEAICARDPQAAEREMREHLLKVIEALRAVNSPE